MEDGCIAAMLVSMPRKPNLPKKTAAATYNTTILNSFSFVYAVVIKINNYNNINNKKKIK